MSAEPERSLADAEKVLDRALASPKGLKIEFEDNGRAVHFRARLYKARDKVKKTNKKIYPYGDPKHDTTVYDGLIFNITTAGKGNGSAILWIVKAERMGGPFGATKVEEIE